MDSPPVNSLGTELVTSMKQAICWKQKAMVFLTVFLKKNIFGQSKRPEFFFFFFFFNFIYF